MTLKSGRATGLQRLSGAPISGERRPLRFSIIINTDARIDHLKRTLQGLKYLDYPAFEVCVVVGPTDDGSYEHVKRFEDELKIARCDRRNLSQSRNIGIALAAGDIVVFIDDDAVPEPEWLTDLAAAYTHEGVGAAGGFVYDNTGVKYQATYVTTNRLAYPTEWDTPAPHLNYPFSPEIPHLLGTNCSFRRSVLLEIGGFDEEYEYFLDETDVCCRVNDAGYAIVQTSNAFVHHKFAPSAMRDEKKIVRHWYPLIKNRVYFGLRNALNHVSRREAVQAGLDDAASWARSVDGAALEGIYSAEDVERFREDADRALVDGVLRGSEPAKYLTPATLKAHHRSFKPFEPLLQSSQRRVICLVTQDYPPGQNGGIARYFSQLAAGLAREGHHVHVLTLAKGFDTLDFEDGVWVHRMTVPPAEQPENSPIEPHRPPAHIWNYGEAMLAKVKAINERRPVSAVYCPLWDGEALAFVLDGAFPVVCALQTTMKIWLESQPGQRSDAEWMASLGYPIMAIERVVLEKADAIHAISHAILEDIQREYEIDISSRSTVFPLGLEDWSRDVVRPVKGKARRGCAETRLLFVGRLEKRKGIDTLLAVAPAVLERFPHAALDIVGDDTIDAGQGSTYRESFSQRKLSEDVRSRIRFHGRVEESVLQGFYRDADIFVAPSRYESFGLIFVEAMMFSKPVIGCGDGGGPEIIADGTTGILVKPGSEAELEKALVRLLDEPATAVQMGKAGRKAYLKHFTDAAMTGAFLNALPGWVESPSADVSP